LGREVLPELLEVQDLRGPKELWEQMVKMENLVLLGLMVHQEIEDLQVCLVQMDLLGQEVCKVHKVKEEMAVNQEKRVHQEDLDYKVHLVHLVKGGKEVRMVCLEKLVPQDWVEGKGTKDHREMLDHRD
jgi:hypothetical protein